ncbi:MAG: hypothetical protein FWD48_10670 [Oscillospiraceae bacterium]|nr:hypothetical protein [Oscillospiraceae bacterium]
MTSLGKKLDEYYRHLGSRGLLLALFAAALTFNIVFALRMSLPSTADEFNTMAWSAYFSGFSDIGTEASPWLTGFLYTPFYYLFENPVIRYRSMLIMNSVFAALIPLLTYKITASLGLEKAWQRTLCALVVVVNTAVFAQTKLAGGETLRVFLPFLLFYLFIRSANAKNRAVQFFLSFFAAIALSFAPAADSRLWTLAITFILLVLYARFILRVKAISFAGFFPAYAVLTALQVYLNWLLTGEFVFRGVGDAAPYAEQLYHFAISTWGIGVLGLCLCIRAFWRAESPLKLFAFFALLYNSFMTSGGSAPVFLVLFAFCYIFIHGLDFVETLSAAFTLGIIFTVYYYSSSLFEIAEVSAVFCVIALLFVFVSCAERYRRHMISFSLSITLLYTGLTALPAQTENAEALTVSEFIYNSSDAPPTYLLNNADLAPILRFLNRNTVINTAESLDELPDDCFVIFRQNGGLIFAAQGERAEAYALSQVGAEFSLARDSTHVRP